jgi:hypothetical protein
MELVEHEDHVEARDSAIGGGHLER